MFFNNNNNNNDYLDLNNYINTGELLTIQKERVWTPVSSNKVLV